MGDLYILQKRTESTFFNCGIVDDIDYAKAWVDQAWALGYRRFDVFKLNDISFVKSYKLFIEYTNETTHTYTFFNRKAAEMFVFNEGDHVKDWKIIYGN